MVRCLVLMLLTTPMLAAAEPLRLLPKTMLGTPAERVPPSSNLVAGITALAWLPNGDAIVAGDETGRVQLWDVPSQKVRTELAAIKQTLATYRPVARFAVHPDGRIALAHPQQHVRVWNPATNASFDIATNSLTPRMSGQNETINGLAFRPDGQLAIAINSDVFTVNSTGQQVGSPIKMPSQFGTGERVFLRGESAVALASPTVAVAYYEGHDFDEMRSWDLTANKPIATAKLTEYAKLVPLVVSPDARWMIGVDFRNAEGRQWRLLDLATLTQLGTVAFGKRANDFEIPVQFSADGRLFAISTERSHFAIYDVARFQPIAALRLDAPVAVISAAFSPNSRRIAIGTADSRIAIYDLQAGLDPQPPTMLAAADVENLWNELSSPNAAIGVRAVHRLVDHPAVSVPFLKDKLRPITKPNADELAKWIADLDAPAFGVRDAAKKKLILTAEATEADLRKAAATVESAAVVQAINGVIDTVQRSRRRMEGDRLRQSRGVQVLEAIASAESREVLKTLVAGAASASLTQEAADALARSQPPR